MKCATEQALVCRRSNLQRTTDRRAAAPSAVLVNEGVHFLSWQSSCAWAKFALARLALPFTQILLPIRCPIAQRQPSAKGLQF